MNPQPPQAADMSIIAAMFPHASADFIKANAPAIAVSFSAAHRASGPTAVSTKPAPKMNKTELEFARILEARKARGEIKGYRFEAIKLRLADQCWYIPDFFIERENQPPLFCEVKGSHIWDDSKVKFRTAKEIHSWADFEMHQKKSGEWSRIL